MTVLPDTSPLVYGPVPSRRLGRSLGVDLVPFKTCTYDCVYCQLGPTTHKTTAREQWVDPVRVIDDVCARLDPRPDVITLAGSGEPTLYAGLDEVIGGIKAKVDVPLFVITNGSLLGDPDVQVELAQADVVLPSLDAADEATCQAINRPHADLGFAALVDGMVDFRARYGGQIWLEIMLLEGLTASEAVVRTLAKHALRIAPDRIHLNTVVRPPAERTARRVPHEMLSDFAAAFTPHAEVIAGAPESDWGRHVTSPEVLALIARRPCTVADVAAGLGVHRNTAIKALTPLVDRGEAQRHEHDGAVFYTAAVHTPSKEES